MKGGITWLPELYVVNPWTEKTIDDLYSIFLRDFIQNQLFYEEKQVWFFPEKENEKETIFWHLITKKELSVDDRLPDFRRAERLPWANPVINNAIYPEILNWDYEEGNGEIHTYLWLKDQDYLVILKKYKDSRRRLLTAYWIEHENYKRKLQGKYENRKA